MSPQPGMKRRHHVVPKFLLSRFAVPASSKGILYMLDKHTGRVIPASSGNVTIERDFYVLPDDPELAGYAQDIPEDDLARIEGKASAVLRDIVAGEGRLDVFERRAIISLFLATMRARTRREREQFAAASEAHLNEHARRAGSRRDQIERFLLDQGEDASDGAVDAFSERIERAFENDEIKITVPLDRSLGTLMMLAIEMSAVIEQMSWSLIRTTVDQPFVISDCPVAMYDAALRGGRGNALRSSPIAQTTLPIDPRACLMLQPDGAPFLERAPIDDEVHLVNLRTYAWASRWVFSGSEETLLRLHAAAKADPDTMSKVAPRPYFAA